MLNTGIMAALSLLVALQSITGVLWLLLLPIALFWGYLIVSFDGWLIAGTHGSTDASKVKIFVPRLCVSVLIGFAIAEPLVLWVFQPAIHKEVLDWRNHEIADYRSHLTLCNPSSGAPNTSAECTVHLITVQNSPVAARQRLDQLTTERDKQSRELTDINTKLDDLETRAANECSGTPGPGLTGVPGNGLDCQRNRSTADQYRANSAVQARQEKLNMLNDEIRTATNDLAKAEATYGDQLTATITTMVDQRRTDQGQIGILDELKALSALSERNDAVLAAHWLVRFLLLAIDCLPALVKMLSGTTGYDQRVSRQTEVGKNLHERYTAVRERRDGVRFEVDLRKADSWLQRELEILEDRDRAERTEREIGKHDRIAYLADKLKKDGTNG
ncbi:DUF4407 domain-containing protein [Nocardia asteroides]|nr:DUF4407 domain-containing protein [Nocardia asteroides]